MGFPGSSAWSRIHLQCRRPWFNSWIGKIPWRRNRLPSPVFMGFLGGSDSKESAYSVGDLGLISGLGRSPGGGHGNLLQYSCLENPQGQRNFSTELRFGLQSPRLLVLGNSAQHLGGVGGPFSPLMGKHGLPGAEITLRSLQLGGARLGLTILV